MDPTLARIILEALTLSARDMSSEEFLKSVTWMLLKGNVKLDIVRQGLNDSRPLEDINATLAK